MKLFFRSILVAAVGLAGTGIRANVVMPAIFGDHMVLQQNVKIPVWGWADPGELVQVSLGNSQLQTKADAKGAWRVDFAPLPASTTPITMAIGGRNAIRVEGILVGDVWIASGDTNMAYRLTDLPNNGQDVIAQANDPLLRIPAPPSGPMRWAAATGIRPRSPGFPTRRRWLISSASNCGRNSTAPSA